MWYYEYEAFITYLLLLSHFPTRIAAVAEKMQAGRLSTDR